MYYVPLIYKSGMNGISMNECMNVYLYTAHITQCLMAV